MKPPCIRNIKKFQKGCPEKTWNGTDGCPAWIEEMVITKDTTKQIVKKCLDLWMFTLAWHGNGLLEGNQQATESFRNGMCEVDSDTGKVVPKVVLTLLDMANNRPMLVEGNTQ